MPSSYYTVVDRTRLRPLRGGPDLITGGYSVSYGPIGSYQPGPDTTGPTGALTRVDGDIVCTSGQVIENKDIWGRIVKGAANDVKVRNCIVRGRATTTAEGVIFANGSGRNMTIDDCLLKPSTPSRFVNGIDGWGYTMRRCEIVDTVDGCGMFNTLAPGTALETTVDQCWFHDPVYFSPDANHRGDDQTHNDVGAQVQGGLGMIFRGNYVDAHYGPNGDAQPGNTQLTTPTSTGATTPALSCVLFNVNVGTTGGHVLEDNWFAGAYIPINCSGAGAVNLGRMWRNKFSGDSLRTGTQGIPQTILLAASQTCDTGDGTANQNTFYDGTPVLVRHNG